MLPRETMIGLARQLQYCAYVLFHFYMCSMYYLIAHSHVLRLIYLI